MKEKRRPKWKGFSLMELLVVMGVMGLLIGMLLPAAEMIQEKANRLVTAEKLRQMGLAGRTVEGGVMISFRDLAEWAERYSGTSGIMESEYYLLEEDLRVKGWGKSVPERLDWLFEELGGEEIPWSFEVVSPFILRREGKSYPVMWTRGLEDSGYWKDGVYGDRGGFILYSDGRVEFYRDLAEGGGQLVNYQTNRRTLNIKEAIPAGARVVKR